jgi:hypothetical protein
MMNSIRNTQFRFAEVSAPGEARKVPKTTQLGMDLAQAFPGYEQIDDFREPTVSVVEECHSPNNTVGYAHLVQPLRNLCKRFLDSALALQK